MTDAMHDTLIRDQFTRQAEVFNAAAPIANGLLPRGANVAAVPVVPHRTAAAMSANRNASGFSLSTARRCADSASNALPRVRGLL